VTSTRRWPTHDAKFERYRAALDAGAEIIMKRYVGSPDDEGIPAYADDTSSAGQRCRGSRHAGTAVARLERGQPDRIRVRALVGPSPYCPPLTPVSLRRSLPEGKRLTDGRAGVDPQHGHLVVVELSVAV
jgi:hypothetical protein